MFCLHFDLDEEISLLTLTARNLARMAKILSGTETAAEIRTNLKVQVDDLKAKSGGKFMPGLTIVQVRVDDAIWNQQQLAFRY